MFKWAKVGGMIADEKTKTTQMEKAADSEEHEKGNGELVENEKKMEEEENAAKTEEENNETKSKEKKSETETEDSSANERNTSLEEEGRPCLYDLKDFEKKALFEFRSKIEEAILQNKLYKENSQASSEEKENKGKEVVESAATGGEREEAPEKHEEKQEKQEEEPAVHEEKPGKHEEKQEKQDEEPAVHEEKPEKQEEKQEKQEEEPVKHEEKPEKQEEKQEKQEEEPAIHEEKPEKQEEKQDKQEDEPAIHEEKPEKQEEKQEKQEEEPEIHEEKPEKQEEKQEKEEEEPEKQEEKPEKQDEKQEGQEQEHEKQEQENRTEEESPPDKPVSEENQKPMKGDEEKKELQEQETDKNKKHEDEETKKEKPSHDIDKDISLWGVSLLPSKEDDATDTLLLKFLRARDFNVQEAFEMLKNTLEWRKENNIDSILDEDFGDDSNEFSRFAFIDGLDREGQPVCYNVFAVFGDEEMYEKMMGSEEKRNRLLRWRVQLMERGIRQLYLKPGGVNTLLQIIDLSDTPVPSKKELRVSVRQAVVALQDNYPEFVSRIVFVHVPFWYYAYSAIFAPNLTQRTKGKTLYARSSKTHETLLKHIAGEQIPVQFGGLKRENDADFSVEDKAMEVLIKSGYVETIEIPAPEAGRKLMWDLSVSGGEVNYKEEFVPTDDTSYTIIVKKERRIGYQEGFIRNSFNNSEPGKVLIYIDNSSFKKKHVLHRHKAITS